jgi:ribosome-associated protein
MCGCLDVGDGLGVRYGQGDLGELWHRKIGMVGKFDSLEQLFPRVHNPDANAVPRPLPYRGDRLRRLCSALLGLTGNNESVDPVNGMYKTPRGLLIAADAVSWVATRSGGPGGQHANTSDTAVTITVDIERAVLSAPVRDRILATAGPTISASSAGSRSQFRNRATAWAALLERLDEAAKPPPAARRATRPSASAVRKRLAAKRHVAERKLGRQRPSVDE